MKCPETTQVTTLLHPSLGIRTTNYSYDSQVHTHLCSQDFTKQPSRHDTETTQKSFTLGTGFTNHIKANECCFTSNFAVTSFFWKMWKVGTPFNEEIDTLITKKLFTNIVAYIMIQ